MMWVWIACFLICRIPFVGIWFRMFDTLMHETGHALAAFLLNGQVDKIELNSNLGGKTVYKSKSSIVAFIVLLLGYPFSTWFGTLFIFFIHKQLFIWVFYSLAFVMVMNLILWVRNAFGIIWLLLNIAGLLLCYYYLDDFWMALITLSISGIMIVESIYATFQLMISSFKSKSNGGDHQQLKQLTKIPSVIWAIVFFASSLFSLYVIFNFYAKTLL
jgi:hypothetical protein